MIEVDCPHVESTRPDTQPFYWELFADIPGEELGRIFGHDASEVFEVNVPEAVAHGTRDFRATLGR